MEKSKLIEVAEELNDVMGLEPAIDTSVKTSELEAKIKEAAAYLEADDKVSKETEAALRELGVWVNQEEEEPSPSEPEAKGKPTPKKEKKAAAKKEDKQPSMAKFIDALLQKGGTWDEITEVAKKEGEARGIKTLSTKAAIVAHAKFRVKNGMELELTDVDCQPA